MRCAATRRSLNAAEAPSLASRTCSPSARCHAPDTKKAALTSGLFEFRVAAGLLRQHALALQALALQLAIAAYGLSALAGALLTRLLVVASELHLAEDAFALHLLLQRLQRLVDIVVANDDLQRKAPDAFPKRSRYITDGVGAVNRGRSGLEKQEFVHHSV